MTYKKNAPLTFSKQRDLKKPKFKAHSCLTWEYLCKHQLMINSFDETFLDLETFDIYE